MYYKTIQEIVNDNISLIFSQLVIISEVSWVV